MAAPRDNMTSIRPIAAAAGVVILAGVFLAGSSWTGVEGASAAVTAVSDLATGVILPLAWLAAAAGYGWLLIRRLWPPPIVVIQQPRPPMTCPTLQVVLGVAAMLFLDGALGRLGLLTKWNGGGAIALTAIGLGLLAVQLGRALPRPMGDIRRFVPRPHPLLWLAAPAAAILLLAAVTPPGWLWASEFGGYDALSYHLQLPQEWLAIGRMRGLEHNVYSHLPSSMEAAYLHLAALAGNAREAAVPAQLLHALIGVLAAAATGLAVRSHVGGPSGAAAGSLAFGLVLTLPWVVVVGSLAYNELPVLLFLAGGLLIVLPDPAEDGLARSDVGAPLMLGVLAGSATAAKLTAAGFVALPLAALLLVPLSRPPGRFEVRRTVIRLAVFGAAALLPLLPWLIANSMQTGNPVFPFAGGLLGSGHWTAEQAASFRVGHAFDGSMLERLAEGARQLFRYGIGPSPYEGEPWKPQWAILPWVGVAAIAIGLARKRPRAVALRLAIVVAIQFAFWLTMTHIKSRFMLPMAVPAAWAVASLAVFPRNEDDAPAATGRAFWSPARLAAAAGVALLVVAQAATTAAIYRGEQNRAPARAIGAMDVFTGAAYVGGANEDLAYAPPGYWLRHGLGPDARVLAIGAADPFYWWSPDVTYATVWDLRLEAVGALDPDALRTAGYTHLLLDPGMLANWADRGWGDARRMEEAMLGLLADSGVRVAHRFPGGRLLVAIGPG
jgi:hypothetical protein